MSSQSLNCHQIWALGTRRNLWYGPECVGLSLSRQVRGSWQAASRHSIIELISFIPGPFRPAHETDENKNNINGPIIHVMKIVHQFPSTSSCHQSNCDIVIVRTENRWEGRKRGEMESLISPYPSNKSDEQPGIEQPVGSQSALIGSVLRAD